MYITIDMYVYMCIICDVCIFYVSYHFMHIDMSLGNQHFSWYRHVSTTSTSSTTTMATTTNHHYNCNHGDSYNNHNHHNTHQDCDNDQRLGH